MNALLAVAWLLASVYVAAKCGWWLLCVVLGIKKRHRLCGGNGCRLCGDGRVYRSRAAGWMRKGK